MSDATDTPTPTGDPGPPPPPSPRRPSLRASALLGALMLALGIGVGAAIGPAPDASYAGASAGIAQELPALLAAIESRSRTASSSPTPSAPTTPAAIAPPVKRARHKVRKAVAPATPAPATPAPTTPPTASSPSTEEPAASAPAPTKVHKGTLPAVTSVWLIELAGAGFTPALAQPAAAPYIDSQLLPASTLLSGWSALTGSAFASEAALAEPTPAGAAPPLLHTIVQPPCPEGAAGASCAAETPGQLAAADAFLKSTLAQITGTPAYREHGLIVVTFATVAIATQAGLPAGTSSSTLTSQPPVGVALMSPFAHAGLRSASAFNPTSPRQSLEALLH